jgi:hypothetical protein
MGRSESRHSINIPDEVYGITSEPSSRMGRRVARTSGEIAASVSEIYGAGMALLGTIPGSAELVRAVSRIPEVVPTAHVFGVSPRDIVIGALIGIGEEPTRRSANRARKKIFGSQTSNNPNPQG